MNIRRGQYLSSEYLQQLYEVISEISREAILCEMPHLRMTYMLIMLESCVEDMSILLFNTIIGDRGICLSKKEREEVTIIIGYPRFIRNFFNRKELGYQARKMTGRIIHEYTITKRERDYH